MGSTTLIAQNLDAKAIAKNTKFRVQGNLTANSVYYNSNTNSNRNPFTYFFQGSLQANWLTFSMPVSYSISNQGANLDYQVPFKFNRLSLHPKYKWIQAHIGDVSMSFSPYTLNGHPFTGGGLSLTPKGSLTVDVMGGQLLKATEDSEDQRTLPAFKRMGYGAKLVWDKGSYQLGLIGFYAKDAVHSIDVVPETKGVLPKENMVLSVFGEADIAKGSKLKVEYATTAITQDIRAEASERTRKSIASWLLDTKMSTENYEAYKLGFDFTLWETNMGVTYERIDPGYQTLGAQFFNNDFENVTYNAARTLFNSKLNLNVNAGFQRDNLLKQKDQQTQRLVGSVNATLTVNPKISFTAAYSNFSTHTNKSLNQFEDINDSDLTDEDLEALDFKQLSQNANLGMNWVLGESEKTKQNLSLNYNLASSANEENGIIRKGQANNFHNSSMVYTLGFPKQQLNVSTSLNYNYSDVGEEDTQTKGGSLQFGKKFFKEKLQSNLGFSYNQATAKTGKTAVFNIRANASTVLAKNHHISLNAVQLFRNSPNKASVAELTLTLGYNYAFKLGVPKWKRKQKEDKKLKIAYKTHYFEGYPKFLTGELITVKQQSIFGILHSIDGIKQEIEALEWELTQNETTSHKAYKKQALQYLKYLYKHKDFLEVYESLVVRGLDHLKKDAIRQDRIVDRAYNNAISELQLRRKKQQKITTAMQEEFQLIESKFTAHHWMQAQLKQISNAEIIKDEGLLFEFREKHLSTIFKMVEDKTPKEQIQQFLEHELADFFHKKSFQAEVSHSN
ncbi:MAG: hypothetical protein OIF50_04890 [Flavobacteriaceae bacterium]|nr:hypothetical protein [Flavobacteriaceae bacterium]